jgi:hypothetical protein
LSVRSKQSYYCHPTVVTRDRFRQHPTKFEGSSSNGFFIWTPENHIIRALSLQGVTLLEAYAIRLPDCAKKRIRNLQCCGHRARIPKSKGEHCLQQRHHCRCRTVFEVSVSFNRTPITYSSNLASLRRGLGDNFIVYSQQSSPMIKILSLRRSRLPFAKYLGYET